MLKRRFIKTMTFIVGSMLAFAIVACGDSGSKSSGGLNPGTATYAGTANSVLYTLTITEKAGKAAYAPQGGDSYELTAAAKTSTGTVESFVSGTFTLAPSGDSGNTFLVTVSGIGITAMSGTIIWDGGATESAPANFIPKTTGAADDPFLISTSADLLKVGKGTDGWTLDAHYKLINDIDMTGVTWTPIGYLEDPGTDWSTTFTGSFDGNGFKIYNITINSTSDLQGLFGTVGPSGTVKNLGLEDVDIKGSESVGGIVGFNLGTIENCYVGGVVNINSNEANGGIAGANGGTIEYCYVTGNVTSNGDEEVGGIVGDNFSIGTIKNCYTSGNITGDGYAIGGIAGNNGGTIENCYTTGDVTGEERVGGVAGASDGTIKNCYVTGNITSNDGCVGGIAGNNYGGTIENCYVMGNVTSNEEVSGGIVGSNYGGGTIKNCYVTGNVTGSDNDVGGIVGVNGDEEGGTPVGDGGTIENCYVTGNVSGSFSVGGVVGVNNVGTIKNCVALNVIVTAVSAANNLGCVVGRDNSGTLSNNYARDNMTITGPGYSADVGADKKDGADMTVATLNNAWWAALPWDFTGVWNNMDGGKLPTLRGVGGSQNPTVVP